jgi:hypothetical protein
MFSLGLIEDLKVVSFENHGNTFKEQDFEKDTLEKHELFMPYFILGVVSCKKKIKKKEFKENIREEEESSKEVWDIDKSLPTREESCDDEKKNISLFDP